MTKKTKTAPCLRPLRAEGKSIKTIEGGRWKTFARVDTRGRFLPGYEEAVAADLADRYNVHEDLVKLLHDTLPEIDFDGDSDCIHCGRHMRNRTPFDVHCKHDDCPGNRARVMLRKYGYSV